MPEGMIVTLMRYKSAVYLRIMSSHAVQFQILFELNHMYMT